MLSAKAGAEHVYAIEANKHLTSLAEHIIGCNGLTDQITVVYVAAVISHACRHFRLVSFLPTSPVSPSLTRLFPCLPSPSSPARSLAPLPVSCFLMIYFIYSLIIIGTNCPRKLMSRSTFQSEQTCWCPRSWGHCY